MRKKSLIIAIAAVMGVSMGAGTATTSFAAEEGITALESESVFDDGSEDIEVEEPEMEENFSAGESKNPKESNIDFEDGENESETASAATGTQDFRYQIDGILEQVTIVKYEGMQADVVIPEEIEGYPVTKISSGIFSENNEIQSLTITGNVREIGENAFEGLDNLERVTISTKQKEIKGLDFSENKSLRLVEMSGELEVLNRRIFSGCSSLVKVVFPPNLTKIGAGAFSGTGIESVVVPDSVSEMGDAVFGSCPDLKKATLSKNLKVVPEYAFSHDKNLQEVILPHGIESIEKSAFESSGIQKINLPETLKVIGFQAFYKSQLQVLDIPASVTYIGESALATGDGYRYGSAMFESTIQKLIIRGNPVTGNYNKISAIFDYVGYCRMPEKCYFLKKFQDDKNYDRGQLIDYPKNLSLSTSDDTTARITWSLLNDEAEYKIYRSESPNGPFNEIATTFNSFWDDKDLDSTKNYYYQICAYYEDDDVLGNMSPVLKRERGVSIKDCTIESIEDQWYTGSEIKPQITVRYQGIPLVAGRDFLTTYLNNIEEGTATIQVRGTGQPYYDVREIEFHIKKKNIESLKISSGKDTYVYTGKEITPAVTVTSDSKTLKKGTDYTVEYKDNIAAGTATVTVTGTGRYTGIKTVTFKIVKAPAKTTISSITVSGTKKLIVKWKKVKGVQGYELYRKSQFDEKYQKVKTISNGNTTRYSNSGLDGGTKYTYKIRSYYVVNGKKVYSAYSPAKSATTKTEKLYTGTYIRSEGRAEWFVRIYKSGGKYYAETGRNHTIVRTTYKLTNYKTNYYGTNGGWRLYVVGDGKNRILVSFNDDDYEYYYK